jgi:hypothetical protein
MAEESGPARFFIQIDPKHQNANIARWVQFDLTNEFLFHVRDLHRLLDLYRLEQVTSEFEAMWCMADGWEVRCTYGKQDTWLDIWPDGFTIRSHIVKAGESKVSKAQIYCVEVSYGWGSIDEFFKDHYHQHALDDYDHLDTAQGLYEAVQGDHFWEIAFAQELNAHLSRTGERPLYLHEFWTSRLPGHIPETQSN